MRDARPQPASTGAPATTVPPLARGGVDQDHGVRDSPDLAEQLLADPTTRVIVVHRGRGLLDEAHEQVQDAWLTSTPSRRPRLAQLPTADVPESVALVYLGRTTEATEASPAGTAFFAAVLDAEAAAALAPEERWGHLRTIGAHLSDVESTLLTQAVAIGQWHLDHRYSPLTGRPLHPEKAGWVLRAGPDEPEHFPRTDPVVIVAITDSDDRLLLGSNALWEPNRFSLLAGFVEPGESLEAAVQREIREESGLLVTDPRYLGSQSWPFPRSLMLGFHARVAPGAPETPTPDGVEIVELRWFTRDELDRDTDILLPGPTSIARAIIEQWRQRQLPGTRT